MSILIVHLLTATLFLAMMLAPPGPTSLPWTFPGDFRERLRMSNLVVSGTIEETFQAGNRTVDGTEVTAHAAHVRVDRVFQGNAAGEKLRFAWSTLRMPTTGGGFAYSGPPLADFRPGKRYLIFLKRHAQDGKLRCPCTQSTRSWRQSRHAVRLLTCRRCLSGSDTRSLRRNWRALRWRSLSSHRE